MTDRFDRNTRFKGKPYDGTDFEEQDEVESLFGRDNDDPAQTHAEG